MAIFACNIVTGLTNSFIEALHYIHQYGQLCYIPVKSYRVHP